MFPILVLLAGIFIVLAWVFVATPYLESNYTTSYYEAYNGKISSISSLDENLPPPTPIYTKYVQEVSRSDNDTLNVFSTYVIYDATTDEVMWESNSTNLVDKYTGKYVEPQDTYFRFPPNTQKQNYLAYLYASGDPQPFVFEEKTTVNGLPVYRFSCHLVADLSDSYPEFSPHTVLSDYSCNVWIEPSTGDEVCYEESWTDYAVDGDTKIPVSVGNTKTLDFTKDILVEKTSEKIRLFYVYEKIIPLLLSLIAASVFVVAVVYQRQKQKIAELRLKKEKDDKLQTIGLLASRLAHDIRNPLSVIKGTVDVLSEGQNTDSERRAITRLNTAVSRINQQINNVMDFVRTKPLALEVSDVSSIVNKSIKSMEIPKGILLNVDVPPIKIKCDPSQLEIVFVNLIRNAIEALDGIGTVSVRAFEKGDLVYVVVEDSGSGVPDDISGKIFDPLFTTKQTGTGLGLVSCKTIVEQHGGKITFSRDPSAFTVTIPKSL